MNKQFLFNFCSVAHSPFYVVGRMDNCNSVRRQYEPFRLPNTKKNSLVFLRQERGRLSGC